MLQILNWEFQSSTNATDAANSINVFSITVVNGNGSKRSECVFVQPGPSWRDILISSGHTGWLLSLYGALRQKFSCDGYWLDCPIAVAARKLIVQLCSLTGTVFPSDNGQLQEHHLLQLFSGVILWIDPPDAVTKAIESGRSESEMLDGCRALLSLATITSPNVFDQLLKSMRPVGTISLLSALMSEVVQNLIANNSEEETWSWVARDILLDSWTALLVPVGSTSGKALLPQESINAAANLFALIVEAELKAASASVSSDEDDPNYLHASVSVMDERLSSYALIARAAIDVTLPFLTRLFSERFVQLHKVTDELLEELYSLLLITGHVLADEGEGETPLVPMSLQTNFGDVLEMDKHPVVVLSCTILKFAEQCLNAQVRASIFSPRLMEAVVWFLARWSSTYVMPIQESLDKGSNMLQGHDILQSMRSREAIFGFFSEHSQGKPLLDVIVRISTTTLISYPGEKDLQALTCYQLLPALVRRKNVCSHLVALDTWRELANVFAYDRALFSLNPSHQRQLAKIIVLSGNGMKTSEASKQYVRDLMGQSTLYLVDICHKSDFKSIAQQPDVILSVSCLLERLRGAANTSEPRTQKAVYEIGFSIMDSILILLQTYKDEFVVDWVDGQITYLEAKETAVVVNFCMRLLQIYSSHNIGKISLSASKSLLSEEKTEKYKDLRALIQLLTHLCSKDLVDFSSDSIEAEGTNICQVVYFGLHIVTPLISLELLKYPKLCHDYFALISHMLEVYPEMVNQLNDEAFTHMLGTLDFGIHHQDSEVVDMCMRALKALAAYHYKEINVGKSGLGVRSARSTDPNGNVKEGVLSRFLRSLLQLLLFEDYSTDLVSAAADALLPLILCEQELYQRLGSELIERQSNPTLRTRLANALHSLTSSNQVSSTLDRINYQRFRKNLHNFLIEVRGFLRTK